MLLWNYYWNVSVHEVSLASAREYANRINITSIISHYHRVILFREQHRAMTGRDNTELTPYLKKTAGEYLRGVVWYQDDEYDIQYIRDDLRTQRFKAEVDKMITRLRRESRLGERRAFPFGEVNAIVRSFDEAMVMHFPHTQSRGTVVTLDPEVARQLNTFIGSCLERIDG